MSIKSIVQMKFHHLYLIIFSLIMMQFNPPAFAETKKVIYIYKDVGNSQSALLQAVNTFKTVSPSSFTVKTIDAKEVIKNNWSRDAALFVMPGGADLPYVKKLNGKGNFYIKNYVKNGGAYLGLCAGAYYASLQVEFDKNGALEVLGIRELAFFNGKSIGPVLAKYDYKTQSGARAAKIKITSSNLKEATIYYNGGGYFNNADKIKNVKVMGYYSNQKPAIISIKYDKGYVVLSGVHFEYDSSLLDPKDPFLVKLIPELNSSNKNRLVLLNNVLKELHIEGVVERTEDVFINF